MGVGGGGVLRELQEEVDRAKLPKFFQDFALIETEAVSRFAYDPLVVPGLLQTPEYARALLSALPSARRRDDRAAGGRTPEPAEAPHSDPSGGTVIHHR